MSPEDLRKQASAAEFLAAVVSYGRDKARLQAKADALRLEADTLERGAAGTAIPAGAVFVLARAVRARRPEHS